jgi:osmotically inducible lipoprotein OsmB
MKGIGLKLAAIVGLLALTACGETTGDSGLSGAGIRGAGGAVRGARVGDPLAGPVIGAGMGAGIDLGKLGKPIWER